MKGSYTNSCTNSIFNYDQKSIKIQYTIRDPYSFPMFYTEHLFTPRGTRFENRCITVSPKRSSYVVRIWTRLFYPLEFNVFVFSDSDGLSFRASKQYALFINVFVVLCHTVFCKHVVNEDFSVVQGRDARVTVARLVFRNCGYAVRYRQRSLQQRNQDRDGLTCRFLRRFSRNYIFFSS
jgi:hypothetical protein